MKDTYLKFGIALDIDNVDSFKTKIWKKLNNDGKMICLKKDLYF